MLAAFDCLPSLSGSAGHLLILEAEADAFSIICIVGVCEEAHLKRLAITCNWKSDKQGLYLFIYVNDKWLRERISIL
jgi:hypothetical protein